MADLISSGGLALNSHGELADMPRDLAHSVSGKLLDVLTLLHAIDHELDGCNGGEDADGMTSGPSRATSLSRMADDKVRSILRDISPYV